MGLSNFEGLLFAGALGVALFALGQGDPSDRPELKARSAEEFARFLQPETRIERYPALVTEWSRDNLAAHFPKAIPAEATTVRLSSHPGYLQGGGWLQVRLVLPAAQVKAIYDDATVRTKAFYDGGDKYALEDGKGGGGPPGMSFMTSDDGKDGPFPKDYRVFIFAARDGGETSFHWNHGDSSGVVVSTKRNEVIYFAESW